jgi:ADP-ribose pyrophosphatase YjhB (NUDIX family)
MYVTDDMIARMCARFGDPQRQSFQFETLPDEFNMIRSSQKNGRNHDVTLYIRKGDKLVVIAKHPYPEGLYRCPSGGLIPGEPFLDGIARETEEETGCQIEISRFLLWTSVRFVSGDDSIDWRSFVFVADYLKGDFQFTDHSEIRQVKLADWSEFEKFREIMLQSKSGGLHYRAALHEAVLGTLPQ